ncbi:MAG TPA: hypothetical protein VER55_02800, partial [Ardenticatenaceae bacterium]|nr:hypothetical protein [Ardenticatenaceae bacterium]
MQSVSRVVEESAQPTAVIVGATRAQLRRYAPILEGAGYQLAVIEVPGDVPTNTSAQQAALMIFNTSVGETDILLAYRSLPRRAPLVLLDGETALPRDGFERHQRVPYGPEEFAWLLRRLALAGRDAPIDTRPAPDVPRVTDAPAPTAPAPQPPPPIERPAPAMPPPSSDAGVPRDVRPRADDTWLEERTPGQRVVDAPPPQKEPAASEVAPEAVRWRRPESAREVAADSIPEMTRVPVARPARVLEEPRREVRPRRPWPAVLLLVTLLLLILAIGTWFLRRDTTVGS